MLEAAVRHLDGTQVIHIHARPPVNQLLFRTCRQLLVVLPGRDAGLHRVAYKWPFVADCAAIGCAPKLERYRRGIQISRGDHCNWAGRIVAPAEIDIRRIHGCVKAQDVFVEVDHIGVAAPARDIQAGVRCRAKHGCGYLAQPAADDLLQLAGHNRVAFDKATGLGKIAGAGERVFLTRLHHHAIEHRRGARDIFTPLKCRGAEAGGRAAKQHQRRGRCGCGLGGRALI